MSRLRRATAPLSLREFVRQRDHCNMRNEVTNLPADPVAPLRLAADLLTWWDSHGRKDLPWQREPTPYRVWVSEIMLQQTQVATVIPYYQRFMARFPDITALADASIDELLHHWSGLGYYARARHLHRSAALIRDHHGGIFPADLAEVMALPGIGRSTAGAILALAFGQHHPILDGNVKRVLTRLHGIDGWPGRKDVEQRLWELAAAHTPPDRTAHYTQAIMDLGATLCTRSRPACPRCPLAADCVAHRTGRSAALPTAKPRRAIPARSTQMLLVLKDNAVLLLKRPPAGIWGGLWSLPECPAGGEVTAWCREHLHVEVTEQARWAPLRHTFSHFHLDIQPVLAHFRSHGAVMDGAERVWYNLDAPPPGGLAAPVRQLLDQLKTALQ